MGNPPTQVGYVLTHRLHSGTAVGTAHAEVGDQRGAVRIGDCRLIDNIAVTCATAL